MTSSESIDWRVRTEDGGLVWLDPGDRYPSLRAALEDCVETLSPVGEQPALSTYWLDLLLDQVPLAGDGEIAHGNLWVLTANGDTVEVRMDVDSPDSEPLDVVLADDLQRGLLLLRSEVLGRLAEGHVLDDRHWSQKNP